MKKVLVTGGTGVLGREIVAELRRLGAEVVVLSHSRQTRERYGDLLTGEGLEAALQGIEVVVHAATAPQRALHDLQMTQNLVSAVEKSAVQHLIYVSIAGIDQVQTYDYYRVKLAGEGLVARSRVPHTIQRATQFFEFLVGLLEQLRLGPVQIAPSKTLLQPVAVSAVGQRVAALALREPRGRVPDLAGPAVIEFEALARDWHRATGAGGWVIPLAVPHPGLEAMRTGKLVPASPEIVGNPWHAWLTAAATAPNPYLHSRR